MRTLRLKYFLITLREYVVTKQRNTVKEKTDSHFMRLLKQVHATPAFSSLHMLRSMLLMDVS